MPGDAAFPGRMAWAAVRSKDCAGCFAPILVCRQSFRISLFVHLGARHAATLPLRPVDGIWLEVLAATGAGKSDWDGDCRCMVKQYPVVSNQSENFVGALFWVLSTGYWILIHERSSHSISGLRSRRAGGRDQSAGADA